MSNATQPATETLGPIDTGTCNPGNRSAEPKPGEDFLAALSMTHPASPALPAYTRYARMAVQLAEAGETVSALTLREIAQNLPAEERDLIERAARLAEVAS